MKPDAAPQFKSQDYGCRFSLKLAMPSHSDARIRSHAPIVHAKIHYLHQHSRTEL